MTLPDANEMPSAKPPAGSPTGAGPAAALPLLFLVAAPSPAAARGPDEYSDDVVWSPNLWREPKEPDWSKAGSAFGEAADRLNIQTGMGPVAGPAVVEERTPVRGLPGWLIYALIAVVAAGIVLVLVKYYRTWSIKTVKKKEPEAASKKVDTAPLLKAGMRADQLAKEDNFVEAMHTLLLDTIEELRVQRNQRFPPSFTSREIAAGLSIGQKAAGLLTEIVAMVEPTWFGNDSPGREQYATVRRTYDAFIATLRI